MGAISKIRHHPYAKLIIPVVLIVCLVFGLFFSLGFILNTETPLRVVQSSSMSIDGPFIPGPPSPYSIDNVLWTLMHPFNRTLNVCDIIIIQGVDPKTLDTNYPNSDIIVYKDPTDPEDTPIVHRIVTSYEVNGTLYFQTKGDGNGQKWPAVPSSSEYDSNTVYPGNGQGVTAELVEGKVILRIPYFGWISLILKEYTWGVPLIVGLILLLLAIEFLMPLVKCKAKQSAESIDLTI